MIAAERIMGFSLVAHCIYHCHGVNHGAGVNQRVARISTRENQELVFGWLVVFLFFSGIEVT